MSGSDPSFVGPLQALLFDLFINVSVVPSTHVLDSQTARKLREMILYKLNIH